MLRATRKGVEGNLCVLRAAPRGVEGNALGELVYMECVPGTDRFRQTVTLTVHMLSGDCLQFISIEATAI